MIRGLGWISALMLLPAAAGAVRVEGVATGVILESAGTAGQGVDVFGLQGNELSGLPFRIDFAYDTEFAPPDSHPSPERSDFESTDPSHAWLELAITVNGRTHLLGGNHRLATVLDIPSQYDHLALHIDSEFESDDGNVHRLEAMGLNQYFEPEAFEGDALPTGFSNPHGLQLLNGVFFLIDDFDLDPASGEITYQRSVTFQATVEEISAQVVPEPASGALLTLGLIALCARRSR